MCSIKNIKSNRHQNGLSLIELIFMVAILGILLTAVSLNIPQVIEKQRLNKLVTEIEGLFESSIATSLARNQDVVIEFSSIPHTSGDETGNKDWTIKAMIDDELIAIVEGALHPNIYINQNYQSSSNDGFLSVSTPNAIASRNGRFTFYIDESNKISVITNNMTGRIYTCSENGGYSYGQCSS